VELANLIVSIVSINHCSPMRMTQCSHALVVFTMELAKIIVFIVSKFRYFRIENMCSHLDHL